MVEDAVVREVVAKGIIKPVALNSRQKSFTQHKVEDAETILLTIEESALANTISYNTVMSIILKNGLSDSPRRAEMAPTTSQTLSGNKE